MHSIKLKVDPTKLPEPRLEITRDNRNPYQSAYPENYQDTQKYQEQPTHGGAKFPQQRKCRGRIWTYDEEQVLVDGLKEGISEEEVAQRLGRTVDAVKNRKARIRERGRVVEH